MKYIDEETILLWNDSRWQVDATYLTRGVGWFIIRRWEYHVRDVDVWNVRMSITWATERAAVGAKLSLMQKEWALLRFAEQPELDLHIPVIAFGYYA